MNENERLKKHIKLYCKGIYIIAVAVMPTFMLLFAFKYGILKHQLWDGIEFLSMGISSIFFMSIYRIGNLIFDKNKHNKSKQLIGLRLIIPTYLLYMFVLISFMAKVHEVIF